MGSVPDDEPRMVARMMALATRYGRYGYRRITALLRGEGWLVNHKRVERLWRREGLKVPQRQPKRGRLWLADGSCVRRRPTYRHHVWAYDFVAERTHEGRPLKILAVVDEYSRECLALVVARRLRAMDVLETLAQLFVTHGVPAHIRLTRPPWSCQFLRESWAHDQPADRCQGHGLRRWRTIAQRAVRPHRVVLPPPSFDHDPGFCQCVKDLSVQQFIT